MAEAPRPPRWRPATLIQLSLGLHAAGVAALAATPSWWPLWVGAMVVDHAVMAAAGMSPRSRLLGPNLSRLPAAAADRQVALTFDDGPDPEVTPRVLDLLDEHGAVASFFCIGRRAAEHPDLVSEIARRGHRVENHSYAHAYGFAFTGPRSQGRDIDRAQETLEEAAGRRPVYFRAPAGMRNPWLDMVLSARRLTLASWTRRGYDAVDRRPARVARRLLAGLAAGDVLLLHDGSAARDPAGRPVVLEVLPRLLDAIADRGWRSTYLPDPSSDSLSVCRPLPEAGID